MADDSMEVIAAHDGDGPKPAGPSDAEIDASIAAIASKLPADQEDAVITRQERAILELYNELKDLELEQAILQAEADTGEQTMEVEDQESTLEAAQKELLEARATYLIRQNVVDDVLQADPVLKAVHIGANATPAERALQPLVARRDILAMCHNCLSSSLYDTLDVITVKQAENLAVMHGNRTLAAELLELTSKLKDQELDSIQDTELMTKLQAAEAQAKEMRSQYRLVKGLVGGVIAGSGVDWAKDDELRDLVLDPED